MPFPHAEQPQAQQKFRGRRFAGCARAERGRVAPGQERRYSPYALQQGAARTGARHHRGAAGQAARGFPALIFARHVERRDRRTARDAAPYGRRASLPGIEIPAGPDFRRRIVRFDVGVDSHDLSFFNGFSNKSRIGCVNSGSGLFIQ